VPKHAVWIESGGIVPLPRVGGALSHAVASIRNLQWHCQSNAQRELMAAFVKI